MEDTANRGEAEILKCLLFDLMCKMIFLFLQQSGFPAASLRRTPRPVSPFGNASRWVGDTRRGSDCCSL